MAGGGLLTLHIYRKRALGLETVDDGAFVMGCLVVPMVWSSIDDSSINGPSNRRSDSSRRDDD